MSKIRLGMASVGGIAQWAHLPAVAELEDFELVAVCDPNLEAAGKTAEKYGVKGVYAEFDEMLKNEELDAVDICSPNYLHSVYAVQAFEKGLHVFCEKPDAINVEEMQKMADAAQKSGKQLMVMRNNRFRPTSQFLKRYIEEGNLGEIYAARCGWIRRRGIPGKGGWFTTRAKSGGGPLIDLGVHMIDLAIWLMGNPRPVAVSGCKYRKFADDSNMEGIFDVEDLAMGFIRFENGACMQIEFSWASNIERDSAFVELRGEKAGVSFDWNGLKIFSEACGKTIDIIPNVSDKDVNAHKENIKNFADVILRGAKPIYTPQQGLDMIKILCAFYESADKGREIALQL